MSRVAAIRAAAAGKPAPVVDDNDGVDDADEKPTGPADEAAKPSKKKDTDMSEEAQAKAVEDARKEATAAANARFNAVLASDEYVGREALAKTLLATDLSADQIITSLAASPKVETAAAIDTAAALEASEEAGRDEMRKAIASTKNSAIDTGGVSSAANSDKAAAADAVWDTARKANSALAANF